MLQRVEMSWGDFWAYYYRVERRYQDPLVSEKDHQLVCFIEHVCELSPGLRVLDLACGGGDQARVFGQKGYHVVGIDIAPQLIEFAKLQAHTAGLQCEFIVSDMRELNYNEEFDVCVILGLSFGFFGPNTDQGILHAVSRSLRTGGKLFLVFMPANRNCMEKANQEWTETAEGWELSKSWFDHESEVYHYCTFVIRRDGTVIYPCAEAGYHANEAIQCYTLPELRRMLSSAGLRYVGSYSSKKLVIPAEQLGPEEVRNILVAQKT